MNQATVNHNSQQTEKRGNRSFQGGEVRFKPGTEGTLDLISTWLQPGDHAMTWIGNRLNGFEFRLGTTVTWLKPGANEN